jgi:WD40 repeat protein
MQLAVSSDGTLLATACEDGRIRIWSALTGTIASELLYPNQPEALAFTSEGRLLIVGGKNGLRSFLVSGDDLVTEACRRLQRNFSQAEWAHYVGVGHCRPICAGKPGCE